jgi:hypothetical protein
MDFLEIPRNIIFTIIFISSVVLFAITPLVYSKIVRPIDRLFKGKGLTFEEGLWHVSIAVRMSQYVLCIVFPQRSKKDKYAKLVYQGYDFRGNASKQQVILSYIYLSCLILIFVMGALLILYDFVIRPILE